MSYSYFSRVKFHAVPIFTGLCILFVLAGTGPVFAFTNHTDRKLEQPERNDVFVQCIAKNTVTKKKNENSAPFVKLLEPNGGEVWAEGNTYTIRWVSDGVKRIRIAAAVGGKDRGHIGEGETIDAQKGSYAWKISPGFVTGFGVSKSENVRLMIYDADKSSVFDFSDASFSIAAAQFAGADEHIEESEEEFKNTIVHYYDAIAGGRYRSAYEMLSQSKIVLHSADGSAVSYGPPQRFDTWAEAQKNIKDISVIEVKRLRPKKGPETYSADMGNAEAVVGVRTYKVTLDIELSAENWTIQSGKNSFFIALVKGDDGKIRILGIGTGP